MKRSLAFLIALLLAGCIKRPTDMEDTRPRLSRPSSTVVAEATSTPEPSSKKPASTEEWGEEFFKKGDYRRAVAYLSAALKKNPESANLWRNLGSAYALADDYDNAILCYERALKRNPHDIKTHYNLSLIHNFKGSPQELKAALSKGRFSHGTLIDEIRFRTSDHAPNSQQMPPSGFITSEQRDELINYLEGLGK